MMAICSLIQQGIGMRLVKRVLQRRAVISQLKLLVLLELVLAFQGCVSSRVVKPSTESITIVPFSGVDSIQVGISTKRDVMRTYGKATTKCSWRPNSYPIALGEFVQIIHYPDLGLTFLCDHTNGRRFAKKTVREIEIDSTSHIKTPQGNGVGSSYYDIIKEFGVTKYSRGSFPTFSMTHLSYDKLNPQQIYTIMHFQQFSIVDSNSFQVKRIEIKY